MGRFPNADSLVSWAGMCPRSDESAGKRRSTRIRKGAPWLKTTLIQAAWAASRSKDTYLHALFHRLKARRGAMKAIVAVAASMLRSAYYMLTRRTIPTKTSVQPTSIAAPECAPSAACSSASTNLGVEVIQTRIRDNVTQLVSL
jgi:hypothetical protein